MAESNVRSSGLIVGVDASRIRSGGGKAHLVGVISEGNPQDHGISEVHLWTYKSLLEILPDKPWLIKHNPNELEKSLLSQMWWQVFRLPEEFRENGCHILFNTDAGTLSSVKPCVTMSQDMLSYEQGEIERYGFSKARLRLFLLRVVQNRSLRHSNGAVFLTRYAAKVIQQSCGPLQRVAYIPHGVDQDFQSISSQHQWPVLGERPIRCLYISNTAPYKHQWIVVKAIEKLRKQGIDITLTLVGGGKGKAQRKLEKQVVISDPNRTFVVQKEFVPQAVLPAYLDGSDIFVFASSCENMPITLVEAMAAGIPIACSDRGPMPEVLADGGVYFDCEDPESIAVAIEKISTRPDLREVLATRAKQLSKQYSWARCADETFAFLAETALAYSK